MSKCFPVQCAASESNWRCVQVMYKCSRNSRLCVEFIDFHLLSLVGNEYMIHKTFSPCCVDPLINRILSLWLCSLTLTLKTFKKQQEWLVESILVTTPYSFVWMLIIIEVHANIFVFSIFNGIYSGTWK